MSSDSGAAHLSDAGVLLENKRLDEGVRSQRSWSQRLGVQASQYSLWIHGTRTPTVANARRLAAASGVDAAQLLTAFGHDPRLAGETPPPDDPPSP